MKIAYAAIVLLAVSTTACKNKLNSESSASALDPVGLEFHKQEAARLAAESKYKPNDQITLRNTQTMLFDRNPQKYTASGDVIASSSATVIKSEGMFIKVKMDNGQIGYINESDVIDPMENFGFGDYGAGSDSMPAFLSDESLLPPLTPRSETPDNGKTVSPELPKPSAESSATPIPAPAPAPITPAAAPASTDVPPPLPAPSAAGGA